MRSGRWIEVFVVATGEHLLTSWEAEEKAAREEEAWKAAQGEIACLRAEIERLKQSSK